MPRWKYLLQDNLRFLGVLPTGGGKRNYVCQKTWLINLEPGGGGGHTWGSGRERFLVLEELSIYSADQQNQLLSWYLLFESSAETFKSMYQLELAQLARWVFNKKHNKTQPPTSFLGKEFHDGLIVFCVFPRPLAAQIIPIVVQRVTSATCQKAPA